ncbi:hypothetical protein LCGC14_1721780 [marine sediment metagenome]|uniref:Uncharacterized protein n=1 Tax=marine sediment metagenome TaxID=412755 RepID=A0A0F9HC05_9ZZZZ
MKYDAYLTSRAEKQYERLDAHIRNKIRTELMAFLSIGLNSGTFGKKEISGSKPFINETGITLRGNMDRPTPY